MKKSIHALTASAIITSSFLVPQAIAAEDTQSAPLTPQTSTEETVPSSMPISKTDVDKAREKSDTLSRAATQAQQDVDEARAQADAARAGADGAEKAHAQAVENARNASNPADEDISSAKAEQDTAQVKVDQAQAEGATTESSAKEARAADEAAQNQLSSAQNARDTAAATLTSQRDALNQAQSQVTTTQEQLARAEELKDSVNSLKAQADDAARAATAAQQEYEAADAAHQEALASRNAAQVAVDAAGNTATQARQRLNAADADVAAATQTLNDARNAKQSAEAALAEAQNTHNALVEADNSFDARVAEAQTAVQDAQAAVDAARRNTAQAATQFAQGSYGFFESRGNTSVTNLFHEQGNRLLADTVIGGQGDATHLDNMKKALEWIKVFNQKYRVDLGLQPLEVTDRLMAYAQIQLNWSDTNMGHANYYNVAENLSWGSADPYSGWYTKEKEHADRFKTEYQARGKTWDDYLKDYPRAVTGHYENIIDPRYKITGFAVSDNGNPRYRGIAMGQTFDFSGNSGDESLSIDTYYDAFMRYYNDLKTRMSPSAVTQAENALAQANTRLNEVHNSRPNAQSLRDAQNALDAAQSNVTEKDTALRAAQTQLNAANQAKTNAESHLTAAVAAQENANNVLSQAQGTVDARQATSHAAQSAYNAARERAQNAQQAHENAVQQVGNIDSLRADLAAAQVHVTETQRLVDAALTALSRADSELSVAQDTANTAAARRVAAQAADDQAVAVLHAAQAALQEATATHEALLASRNAYEQAQQQVTSTRAALDEALTQRDSADARLLELTTAYEQAKEKARIAHQEYLDLNSRYLSSQPGSQENHGREDAQKNTASSASAKSGKASTRRLARTGANDIIFLTTTAMSLGLLGAGIHSAHRRSREHES